MLVTMLPTGMLVTGMCSQNCWTYYRIK